MCTCRRNARLAVAACRYIYPKPVGGFAFDQTEKPRFVYGQWMADLGSAKQGRAKQEVLEPCHSEKGPVRAARGCRKRWDRYDDVFGMFWTPATTMITTMMVAGWDTEEMWCNLKGGLGVPPSSFLL